MKSSPIISSTYGELFLISINAAGIAILPVISIGYTLYISVGLLGSIATTSICCITLYLVSASIMKIAINYRVNTMEIAAEYFGKKGEPLCSLIIGAAFCGWFIWQLNSFTYFLKHIAFAHLPFLYNISQMQIGVFCCVLFISLAVSGRIGLHFFSIILVPSLLITSILVVILLFQNIPFNSSHLVHSDGLGLSTLSILLSSFAAHALSTPTFYRFASSPYAASRSLKTVYFGLLPLFCGIGMFIAFLSPYQDIYEIFELTRGVWPVVLILYSFLGCWSVCVLNLYYGADAFAHIFRLKTNTSMIFLMGVICLAIICFDSQFGVQTTSALGTMAIGALTIIMTRAAMSGMSLNRDAHNVQMGNCIALICSNLVAFCAVGGYLEITGIPFFDSMLVAFFICAYFSIFKHPKRFRQLS